jgi:hypothetical protein
MDTLLTQKSTIPIKKEHLEDIQKRLNFLQSYQAEYNMVIANMAAKMQIMDYIRETLQEAIEQKNVQEIENRGMMIALFDQAHADLYQQSCHLEQLVQHLDESLTLFLIRAYDLPRDEKWQINMERQVLERGA